jgi:hypothetical protein
MTSRLDIVPVPLLQNLKHKRVVLPHVVTANIARVPPERRLNSRP